MPDLASQPTIDPNDAEQRAALEAVQAILKKLELAVASDRDDHVLAASLALASAAGLRAGLDPATFLAAAKLAYDGAQSAADSTPDN